MKKIVALFMTVITFTLLFTGCVSPGNGVKLNENGTGTITAALSIKEDFYVNNDDGSNAVFADINTLAAKTARSDISLSVVLRSLL